MIQRVWSKWLMARRDNDIWGRPRNGPIIFCCNQKQVTVISPPVQGMHLTLKKQVIRSCYPGWHLILLAFIFRRGERFILEELCLLVQDTGCDERMQRLREIPRGKRAREELPNPVCGGGRRTWLLMAWAAFPAAAEPDLQPSLRAAAPLPRTPAQEGWSRAGASVRWCRVLPAPRCLEQQRGPARGPEPSPKTQRSASFGGHGWTFAAAGRAGKPGLSPAAFKSPWRCQSSNLLPGGSAVAGNLTCPCPSCSSF